VSTTTNSGNEFRRGPDPSQRLLEGPGQPSSKGWFDMDRFMKLARRTAGKTSVVHDERGLTTVEYVIILVLIATMAIVAWGKFGAAVKDKVTDSETQIKDLGKGESSK
jgi:Flp pilus assembly pilin Flp